MSSVLHDFMRRHGVEPFNREHTRLYTVAISDEFWQAARHYVASVGDRVYVPDEVIPGYHQLFGYAIRVDPFLRDDELRLEDRR
jgi:hypothetical protein